MENKNVGWLIIGIGIVVGIIVLIFNMTIQDLAQGSCNHGDTCAHKTSMASQTWISISLVAIILIIGFILLFVKPKEKIVVKKIKGKKKRLNLKGLEKDERNVIAILKKEGGAIFQATLMEKMEIGKVKTTRLLDKLEAKQLIERKRRGMNNIVVLKQE